MVDAAAPEKPIDLPQYLAILRTRKWTIVVCTVIGLIAALGLSSRQTPLYQASAQLLLALNPVTGQLPSAENESTVVASAVVAEEVIESLGLDTTSPDLLGGVNAQPSSPTSDIINVVYTGEDPEQARDIANSFADNYIRYKSQQLKESLRSQIEAARRRVESIQERLRKNAGRLETARRSGSEDEILDLENERATLIAQLSGAQTDLEEARSGIVAEPLASITRPAVTPTSPSSPDHTRNGILGIMAGFVLGIAGAFVRERLDDRFRGRPDVERALESPVLATVPRFPSSRGSEQLLPVSDDPKGAASEAYRNLRTGLQFISTQQGIRTILLTSPSAHEGKTSTTSNLGIALSQTGRRVALVSCDLRRPRLEKYFGAESTVGVSSWLLGEEENLGKVLLEHPAIPNLALLPAGPIPSNPAELLTSPRLPELIARLQDKFDMVLFDSPPVLPVADAVIIASHVGGVILIFDAANTRRSAAIHAKEQIERVGGHLVGCVLNSFDPSSTPYYYEPYRYSYYYAAEEGTGDDHRNDKGISRVVSLRGERRDSQARR